MIGLKNSYELAYNGTENECRFELYADTTADLQGLTHIDGIKIQMGSECTDIATGDKYILNGSGVWVLQPSDRAFSNVYTKTEIDAMIANYYTKTESDALFEWITVTITTDTLPLSFISDGTPLTSVTIKGNEQQNGTPTPSAPVDFVGCGDWDSGESSYAIPLTCAGQTTPVYLGEVSTTRQIKKLVLDGTENFSNQYGTNLFSVAIQPLGKISFFNSYCTHYKYNPIQSGLDANTQNGDYALQLQSTQSLLAFKDTSYSSVADFKSYLAQQYAAGTPVTVWYVLAEPETGIVNEPLYRIGDYADTLTTTTPIPTAKGGNELTVDTTVQPSEVSIAGGIRNE